MLMSSHCLNLHMKVVQFPLIVEAHQGSKMPRRRNAPMPILILKLLWLLIARAGASFTLGREPWRLVSRPSSSSASASEVDNQSSFMWRWYWRLPRKVLFFSESGVGLNFLSMTALMMLYCWRMLATWEQKMWAARSSLEMLTGMTAWIYKRVPAISPISSKTMWWAEVGRGKWRTRKMRSVATEFIFISFISLRLFLSFSGLRLLPQGIGAKFSLTPCASAGFALKVDLAPELRIAGQHMC